MSKMVNKDSLEFLRKMAREGNLESRLKESNDAVGRVAGIDFPKGTRVTDTDEAIKRRVLEAMKRPAAMKAPADEAMVEGLEKLLKKAASKGAGKMALGAITGGLSLGAEAADAPEAGESRETEQMMIDRGKAAQDPLEALRQLRRKKGKEVLDRQDPEAAIEDIVNEKVKAELYGMPSEITEDMEKEAERKYKAERIRRGLQLNMEK
jgi:hypothetical protein